MEKILKRLLAVAFAVLLAAGVVVYAAAAASPRKKSTRPASRATQHSVRPAAAKQHTGKRAGKRWRRFRRARGQRAPEPARIQEIQRALIDRGYLSGPPSGKWDETSIAAMRRFQQANGLDESGKFDAPSLIKLGLGPPTAGVGAPRELASSTGSNSDGRH